MRVSSDFVPVSEFKADAAEHLRRLGEGGEPMVITQGGRPAAVVMSPAAYDALVERARFVEAVAAGLADADAGRTVSHDAAVARFAGRWSEPRR